MSHPSPPGAALPPAPPDRPEAVELRAFARRGLVFVLLGLLLYGGLYFASERLVRAHGERNRFHMVGTSEPAHYDFVILGASRAAVFDYRDMNDRLERLTGARIMNLSTVGGGITINRFLLEYFLTRHRTSAVLYVLDSFAFYSSAWNEDRLRDTELFLRAPWDPVLAWQLLRKSGALMTAVDYISGFSKINNADRFSPDRHAAEGAAFDRVYRPVPQIDRQRLAFLYPEDVDASSLLESPYLARFEELIESVQAKGIRFIVVRPPLRESMYAMLPHEERFDAVMQEVAERHGVQWYDFSSVGNDPELFYDSDHLNQTGVVHFFDNHLSEVLVPAGGEPPRD